MDTTGEFQRRLNTAVEMGWEGMDERGRLEVALREAIELGDADEEARLRAKKRELLAQKALDKKVWYTHNYPANSPWQEYADKKFQMRNTEMQQRGRTLKTDKQRVKLSTTEVKNLEQEVKDLERQRQTGLKRTPHDVAKLELAKTSLAYARHKVGRKESNIITNYEPKIPSPKGSLKNAFKPEKNKNARQEIKAAVKDAKSRKMKDLVPKKQPIPLNKEQTLQKQDSDKEKGKLKQAKTEAKKQVSKTAAAMSKKGGGFGVKKMMSNFKQKRAGNAQKSAATPRPRPPKTVGGAKVATPPTFSKGMVNTLRSRFMRGGAAAGGGGGGGGQRNVKNPSKALGASSLMSSIHPITVTESMMSDRDFFAKIREGQFFLKRVEEALNPDKVVEESATWTKWFNYCKTFLTLWWIGAFGTVFVFMLFDTFEVFDFVFSRDMAGIHRYIRPSAVWGLATLFMCYSVAWDFTNARTESYLVLFALLFTQTLAFAVDFAPIHSDFEWFACPWLGTDNCVEPFDGVTSVIAQVGWYLAAAAHAVLVFCTSVLFFAFQSLRSRWWLFAQWHRVVRVVDTYFHDLSSLRREWDVAVGVLTTHFSQGDPSSKTPEEWVRVVMNSKLFNRFTSDNDTLENVEDILTYLIPDGKELHVWLHNVQQKGVIEDLFSQMYRVSAADVDKAQIIVAEFKNNYAHELPYLYRKPLAYDKGVGAFSRLFLLNFTQVVVVVTFIMGAFVTLWFIFYNDDASLMDSALFSVRTRYLFDVGFGTTSLILALAWESAAMLLDPMLIKAIRVLGFLCLLGPVVGWYYIYNVACNATLHPICTEERSSDYTGTAFFAIWMVATIAYPTIVAIIFNWFKGHVVDVNMTRRHAAFAKLKRVRPRWYRKNE